MTRSHYEVLGVAPSASTAEVRDAYRRLARAHHPDRAATSGRSGDSMPAINEAYRILNDPARRAVYDASLRTGSAARPSTPRSDHVVSDEPMVRPQRDLLPAPRIPWRGLGIAVVVAIVGVFVLSQFTQPSDPQPPDGILRNGDCVEILPNNDASEVPCTGEGDLVVRAFVAFDASCPGGTEIHRDRQGMGNACIERPE